MHTLTLTDAPTLDALLTLVTTGLDDSIDLTSLPTYGGEAPADTAGIYSWDAARLLTHGARGNGWQIVPRTDA